MRGGLCDVERESETLRPTPLNAICWGGSPPLPPVPGAYDPLTAGDRGWPWRSTGGDSGDGLPKEQQRASLPSFVLRAGTRELAGVQRTAGMWWFVQT